MDAREGAHLIIQQPVDNSLCSFIMATSGPACNLELFLKVWLWEED
jgi:hypothetical protein